MTKSFGGQIARDPLHFIWILDCSGSMNQQGKIETLNSAIRNAIPALRQIAAQNPYVEVLMRAVTFGTTSRWHLAEQTPLAQFVWRDVTAEGKTALGSALKLVAGAMQQINVRTRRPVLVLVSDGQPTDDFESGLAALLEQPWGQKAIRIAIAIGGDAKYDILEKFIDDSPIEVLRTEDADTLVRHIHWGTTTALTYGFGGKAQQSGSGSGKTSRRSGAAERTVEAPYQGDT